METNISKIVTLTRVDPSNTRFCAYPNCKSVQVRGYKNSIVFHKFPRNEIISKKWIRRCGRLDLLNKSPHVIHNVYKLCSRHFDDEQYFNLLRRRLLPNALPSIFTLDSTCGCIPTSSLPANKHENSDEGDYKILSRGEERRDSANVDTTFCSLNHSNYKNETSEQFTSSTVTTMKEDPKESLEVTSGVSQPFEFIDMQIKTEVDIKEEVPDEEIDEFFDLPDNFLGDDNKELTEEEDLCNFREGDAVDAQSPSEQFVKEGIIEETSTSSDKTEDESCESAHSFVCYYCGFKSKSKEDVVSHVQFHLVKFKYQCSKCNYKTNYLNNYTEHLSDHSGRFLFECEECDFKTNDLKEKNIHPILHSNPRLKVFRCTKCSYKTRYKKCLITHVEKHSFKKKFECSKCPFETNSRASIERHMMKHASKKLCKCEDRTPVASDSPDKSKDPGKVDCNGRSRGHWSFAEYLEVLWCYRYATHRFFSKKGVSQRHRLMLHHRNKIQKEKLDSISDLTLSDMALDIRIFRTSITQEQIDAVDLDVEEFMKINIISDRGTPIGQTDDERAGTMYRCSKSRRKSLEKQST